MADQTKEIAARIKARRTELGFSYQTLADKTGLSKSTLQRYETGDIKNLPLGKIKMVADGLQTTMGNIMGWNEKEPEQKPEKIESNISCYFTNLYKIPLYESVSAGFGAYASSEILEYIPIVLKNPHEADITFGIRVQGDSMSPRIEDGDIIVVTQRTSVDSGDTAVVLIDGDEGLVKNVIYGPTWIELHSENPKYSARKFKGEEVTRVRVLGKVRSVIKEYD